MIYIIFKIRGNYMEHKNKKTFKFMKLIFLIISLLLLVFLSIKLLPLFLNLGTDERSKRI